MFFSIKTSESFVIQSMKKSKTSHSRSNSVEFLEFLYSISGVLARGIYSAMLWEHIYMLKTVGQYLIVIF